MKSAGSLIFWLFLILFAPVIQAQQGAVGMELSAPEISIEESVRLTIVAIGLHGELDTSELEKNFEIVGRSSNLESQSRFDGSNTTVVQTRSWVLELVPRAVGNFVVPPVRIDQEYSKPLSLRVTPPPQGAERDLFVEATADITTPWVQSQVLLTVRVFQAIEIVDGSLGVPGGDALNVEQLGEDKRYEQTRDGRRYAVTERRFAVFPQKSGRLVIDPVRLDVSVPTDANRVRGFFTPTKNVRRQTNPIQLQVQPRPAAGGRWWLPAKSVTLQERWSSDPDQASIDQPLTRTLILRVVGATTTQLPRVERPSVPGLSLYAEEPVTESGFSDDGLVATLQINWAIIPELIGEHVLPPVAIDWFNTVTGQVETVELNAKSLRVSPSDKMTSQSDGVDADNVSSSNNSSAVALEEQSKTRSQDNLHDSDADTAALSNTPSDISGDSQSIDADGLLVTNQSGKSIFDLLSAPGWKTSVKRWQWVSAGLLFAWLATVFLLLKQRGASLAALGTGSTSNRLGAVRDRAHQLRLHLAPLTEVELCCRDNDPVSLSQAVLRWAERQFPEKPPRSLSILADTLGDHPVTDDLRGLDRVLYRTDAGNISRPEQYKTMAEGLRQAVQAANASDAKKARGGAIDRLSGISSSRESHHLPEL